MKRTTKLTLTSLSLLALAVLCWTARSGNMITVNSTNELVMLNPYTINTNTFVVTEGSIGDTTATIWTFVRGDTNSPDATHLQPILFPTAGNWVKNVGGSGGTVIYNTTIVTNLFVTYLVVSNLTAGNIVGTTNTLAMFTPDSFSVGDSIVTQNSDTNGITINGAGEAYAVFGPGTTNVLKRSGSNLVWTNGATEVYFIIANGAAASLKAGVLVGDVPVLQSTTATLYLGQTGGASLVHLNNGSFGPNTDNVLDHGQASQGWKDGYYKGKLYVEGMDNGSTNFSKLAIYQLNTNSPVVFDIMTWGTATNGANQGFSFRTNGVEVGHFP